MTIRLLCIGKTKDAYLRQAIAEYIGRLRHYTPLEYIEIKAEKRRKTENNRRVKEREYERLQSVLSPQEFVVALDERGTQYSSVEFSEFISRHQARGDIKTITFVMGGATGFSEKFFEEAKSVISLSKMTFPHQLCRLIFVEQLYRAYSILAGEAYHKG
jgi:23S rRNA (pseudouridine1915-N3)-methyltransferase